MALGREAFLRRNFLSEEPGALSQSVTIGLTAGRLMGCAGSAFQGLTPDSSSFVWDGADRIHSIAPAGKRLFFFIPVLLFILPCLFHFAHPHAFFPS